MSSDPMAHSHSPSRTIVCAVCAAVLTLHEIENPSLHQHGESMRDAALERNVIVAQVSVTTSAPGPWFPVGPAGP